MAISDVLSAILEKLPFNALRGAEIGVLRGDTSEGLLRRFSELYLIMIDTWSAVAPDSAYGQSHDCAALQHWAQHAANEQIAYTRTEFAAARRVLLRGPSVTAAKAIADSSLDFVFIDADHTYDAVTADLAAWWPKVRPGGILSGHDYGGRKNRLGIWGVKRAVDEFAIGRAVRLQRAPRFVWWLTRPELSCCRSSENREDVPQRSSA
jgi:hypothetical protein